MERLTTNKPVDEMSMLELVYNSCYVGEDGSAMYEDFETVRNARDFVRNLYKIHLNEEIPMDDDVFDESMIDELQYEPEVHLNGLIALFYRNLWTMADMRERLKAYEDKQEQGLLIEKSELDKYKLALFGIIRNSKVMPTGLARGRTMEEINAMSLKTMEEVLKMCDFDKMGKFYSEAEEALEKMGCKA